MSTPSFLIYGSVRWQLTESNTLVYVYSYVYTVYEKHSKGRKTKSILLYFLPKRKKKSLIKSNITHWTFNIITIKALMLKLGRGNVQKVGPSAVRPVAIAARPSSCQPSSRCFFLFFFSLPSSVSTLSLSSWITTVDPRPSSTRGCPSRVPAPPGCWPTANT